MPNKTKNKQRRVAVSKSRKRSRPSWRVALRPKRAQQSLPIEYRELLIGKVLNGERKASSPVAAEFLYAMYSTSPALCSLSYSFGISLGRLLYKRIAERTSASRIVFRNEYLPSLADFFDAAALGMSTFHQTTHGTIIRVYRRSPIAMGTKTHALEAGIMAGFLGSAGGSVPHVEETECMSEGGEYCEYTATPLALKSDDNSVHQPGPEAIMRLATAISAPSAVQARRVPMAYSALVADLCFDRAYSAQLAELASYVGSFSREVLEKEGLAGRKLWGRIASTISLLNFGEPSIEKEGRKITVTTTLDALLSRNEFATIASAFICAICAGRKARVLQKKITVSKGRYCIRAIMA
jgi:predicted hydrocarbon binding protein